MTLLMSGVFIGLGTLYHQLLLLNISSLLFYGLLVLWHPVLVVLSQVEFDWSNDIIYLYILWGEASITYFVSSLY